MEAVVERSYEASNDDELTLCPGDVITDLIRIDEEWFEGYLHGHKGRFLETFVKLVKSQGKGTNADGDINKVIVRESTKKRRARVLFSYAPSNEDELKLDVGDVIEVLEEVEEGWWRGLLKGKLGVFPSNFVKEEIEVFDSGLIKDKLKENPSEDSITDGNEQSSPVHQDAKLKTTKGVVSGSIFQDLVKPKPCEPTTGKRMSLPKKPPPPTPVDGNAPKLPPKPVKEHARVIYPYEAQNDDELNLKVGDIIVVITKEIEDKGWWKGELNGRVGVFPDNFVQLLKADDLHFKKPERPEKPAAALLSVKNAKPELPDKTVSVDSTAIDKGSKIPPAKPPPPDLPRKDDKPEKPHPGKKPPALPTIKKPNRTSIPSKPVTTSRTPSCSTTILKPSSSVIEPLSPISMQLSNSITNGFVSSVDGMTDDAKSLRQDKNDGIEDISFDTIEPSQERLTHLTANRARVPNRRPPSHIFLKENEKENGELKNGEQSILKKDTSKVPIKRSSQVGDDVKKEAPNTLYPSIAEIHKSQGCLPLSTTKEEYSSCMSRSSTYEPQSALSGSEIKVDEKMKVISPDKEERLKLPPNRPVPPLAKLSSSANKEEEVKFIPKPASGVPHSLTSPSTALSVPSKIPPKTFTDSGATSTTASSRSNSTSTFTVNANASVTTTAPTTISTPQNTRNTIAKPLVVAGTASIDEVSPSESLCMQAEVAELKKQIQMLRISTVSKPDYEELLIQVESMKESIEFQKNHYSKLIRDLMLEIDEEKKMRMTLQVELDRIKKLTATV